MNNTEKWDMGWVPVVNYLTRKGKPGMSGSRVSPGDQPLRLMEMYENEDVLFYLQVPISKKPVDIPKKRFADLTNFPHIYGYDISEYYFGEEYPEVLRGKMMHEDLIYWQKPICSICLETVKKDSSMDWI